MIHIVLGTKAQLVKVAPVMAEMQLRKIPYNFIFTGQHKETIDDLLHVFNLPKPDYIMYDGKDIVSVLKMFFWSIHIFWVTIWKRKAIFKGDKKGIVLVHGDTFSAWIGAVMGRLAGLEVGHVESGLRSFNIFKPFPEELSRLITFAFSNVYFCPGTWTINNLKKYKGVKINTQYNTLLDSLHYAVKNQRAIKVPIPKQKYCVVTIHRFENIFKRSTFRKILDYIIEISKDIKVLFILHPPTVKKLNDFEYYNELKNNRNIELRPRYDYFQFIKLLHNSEFLISDGGSNQEECFYMGKPCILFREVTERKEGVGKNVVISKFDRETIFNFVKNYKNYKIKPLKVKVSPTDKIIKYVKKYQ